MLLPLVLLLLLLLEAAVAARCCAARASSSASSAALAAALAADAAAARSGWPTAAAEAEADVSAAHHHKLIDAVLHKVPTWAHAGVCAKIHGPVCREVAVTELRQTVALIPNLRVFHECRCVAVAPPFSRWLRTTVWQRWRHMGRAIGRPFLRHHHARRTDATEKIQRQKALGWLQYPRGGQRRQTGIAPPQARKQSTKW